MAMSWKAAAAGGAIAGLGLGGLTIADAADSPSAPVGGVDLGPTTTATATVTVTPSADPSNRPTDRSSASSVRGATKRATAPTARATWTDDTTASPVRTFAPRKVKADVTSTGKSPVSPSTPPTPQSPASADSPDSTY